MLVAFRADASDVIGSGHVMRCMTLAGALRQDGADVTFVARTLPDHLREKLIAEGHALHMLPPISEAASAARLPHAYWLDTSQATDARHTAAALDRTPVDWLVVDHYALDQEWESALRGHCRHVMAIDDLADRKHDCDLLLDQNFRRQYEDRYEGLVPPHCVLLEGPFYALLRPEYARLRADVIPRSTLRRILIYFGGSAFADFTASVVDAVLSLGLPEFEIDVVVGAGAKRSDIDAMSAAEGVRVHQQVSSLANLIAEANLGIGAVGATSWERLCLGLPTIAVTLADNQVKVAEELAAAGLIRLMGDISEVPADRIAGELGRIAAAGGLEAWSRRCMDACDGQGARRVVERMLHLCKSNCGAVERSR